MEVSDSVQGECGYCGERVGEGGEVWLPLECLSCRQLFHIRCLKVDLMNIMYQLCTACNRASSRGAGRRCCVVTGSGCSPVLSATHSTGKRGAGLTCSGEKISYS